MCVENQNPAGLLLTGFKVGSTKFWVVSHRFESPVSVLLDELRNQLQPELEIFKIISALKPIPSLNPPDNVNALFLLAQKSVLLLVEKDDNGQV